MKYGVKPGAVNGKAINDLLSLCNEHFVDPFVQPYAGANFECMFCGATRQRDGTADHSAADCPVIKLQGVCLVNSSVIKQV